MVAAEGAGGPLGAVTTLGALALVDFSVLTFLLFGSGVSPSSSALRFEVGLRAAGGLRDAGALRPVEVEAPALEVEGLEDCLEDAAALVFCDTGVFFGLPTGRGSKAGSTDGEKTARVTYWKY